VGEDSKARRHRKFLQLHKTRYPTTKTSKETVINLSGQTLHDAIYSWLKKGLNYDVNPRTKPIEDILAGDEKAVHSLPLKIEEEARQEIVRFTKRSSKPETT
jgi:hypothetical protein